MPSSVVFGHEEPPVVPAGIHLVYYDANGAAVAGSGPRAADRLVASAMRGHGVEGRVGSRIAVAQPVTANETTIGAVDNSATHGRGTVEVRATALPPGINVDIEDEGDGVVVIPENGNRPESDPNGHGLGLWLARCLTEGAGGRLQVKRAGPRPVVAVVLPA